ncbi:hypothetical protein ACQ4PT_014486 [Festuca glaucescens]
MDNPTMEEGSTFPSMEVFRVALKQYAITGKFDIGTVRSEPGRKSRSKRNAVPWDHASTHKDGNPSTPTSPRPNTRSQSARNNTTPTRNDVLAQPSVSPRPFTRSQAAHSPFTPTRTYTSAQPSISPGRVTRSQSALFWRWGIPASVHNISNKDSDKSKDTNCQKDYS